MRMAWPCRIQGGRGNRGFLGFVGISSHAIVLQRAKRRPVQRYHKLPTPFSFLP